MVPIRLPAAIEAGCNPPLLTVRPSVIDAAWSTRSCITVGATLPWAESAAIA